MEGGGGSRDADQALLPATGGPREEACYAQGVTPSQREEPLKATLEESGQGVERMTQVAESPLSPILPSQVRLPALSGQSRVHREAGVLDTPTAETHFLLRVRSN